MDGRWRARLMLSLISRLEPFLGVHVRGLLGIPKSMAVAFPLSDILEKLC